MLGMKNQFDISESIEIREVDIAGVACINKKEFQANSGKFNVTGLYKLSPHLAKPILYTVTLTFNFYIPMHK